MRSADIAEGTEPLVLASALPTIDAQFCLAILTQIDLTKGPIEGHLTVAPLRDRIVGETILAIVEERAPENCHRRPKENGGPNGRSDEKNKDQKLLHRRSLYNMTCWALIYVSS